MVQCCVYLTSLVELTLSFLIEDEESTLVIQMHYLASLQFAKQCVC